MSTDILLLGTNKNYQHIYYHQEIEIIICQFSYHTPYQPETPISARDSRISPRAEGLRADTGVEG